METELITQSTIALLSEPTPQYSGSAMCIVPTSCTGKRARSNIVLSVLEQVHW